MTQSEATMLEIATQMKNALTSIGEAVDQRLKNIERRQDSLKTEIQILLTYLVVTFLMMTRPLHI
jgi:phage terminase Nu1 subunit (DNA packaging protein)